MKVITLISLLILTSCSSKDWRKASRESTGIADKVVTEDIVQIYYARAFSWRGNFGIHPWVAWKKAVDNQYTVAHVTGWNMRRHNTSISVKNDLPDRKWYDNPPRIMFEARGKRATKIIDKIIPLIESYPFKKEYKLWPGPNSNTFVAYLIRNIEELDIELPPHAVGKDYLESDKFLTNTASNTGFTLSLYGLLGLTVGVAEGIEVNILGVHAGVDLWAPALKLPMLGRVGFEDRGL